jgi:L-lactate dehydrogenase complex protein LldG
MVNSSRERILKALRAIPAQPAQTSLDAAPTPSQPSLDSLDREAAWDIFRQELNAVRTSLEIARTPAEAQAYLQQFFSTHGIKSTVRWNHPLLESLDLDATLIDASIQILEPAQEKYPLTAARADLGITAVDAALMDSGTLIVRASQNQPRSASLVPPMHLALVPASALLPGLNDLIPLLRTWKDKNGLLPSAVHCITGPSSTADIELVAVYGVHGPTAVHVLGLDWE